MNFTTFGIGPLDIVYWIVFGIVVALIIHAAPLAITPYQSFVKDLILAILGSIVGGLTVVFFYGYILLGAFILSLVGGIILASIYIALKPKTTTPFSLPQRR